MWWPPSPPAPSRPSVTPRLEWVAVAGSGDAPCPDCEDNGLSGPQQPDQEFPTGHLHPPAHPGCRCLLTRSAHLGCSPCVPLVTSLRFRVRRRVAPLDHRRPDRPGHPLRLPSDVRHLLHRCPLVLLGEPPLGVAQALRDQGRVDGDLRGHLRRDAVGQPDRGRAPRPQGPFTGRRGRVREALPGGDRSLRALAPGRRGHRPVPDRRVPGHRAVEQLDPLPQQHAPSPPPTPSSTATSPTS